MKKINNILKGSAIAIFASNSNPAFAQDTFTQEIVKDDEMFEYARVFAQSLNVPKFTFLFDQILVNERYTYLIDTGSHRGLTFLPVTGEPVRNYLGDRLTLSAINRVDSQTKQAALDNLNTFLNQRRACELSNQCSGVSENDDMAQSIIAEHFPSLLEFIDPQAGVAVDSLAQLQAQIIAEVAENCTAGSSVTFNERALQVQENGNVEIYMGGFRCDWEFGTSPYCGARLCEAREYSIDGGDARLLNNTLK